MSIRRIGFLTVLIACISTGISLGASQRTPNFVVEASTPELAAEFGRLAEKYRREKAIEWLGREMPTWPQPCPLKITVTMGGAGGATSFNFLGNRIDQTMHIEGALDRLKVSVLPHEVTHTVFAYHFRQPVPRWADEGGAVYSEDDLERNRHDSMCRTQLNAGRGFQLRTLFSLKDYPSDVGVLYAEGYSVTAFLIEQGDRQRFLNFVGNGMQNGWDAAVAAYYPYRNVAELEKAWLDYLRGTKSGTFVRNMSRPNRGNVDAPAANNDSTELTSRVIVRDFSPPAQPQLDPPFQARGASPGRDDMGGWNNGPVKLGGPVITPASGALAISPERPTAFTASTPTSYPNARPTSMGMSSQKSLPPVILYGPEPLDGP